MTDQTPLDELLQPRDEKGRFASGSEPPAQAQPEEIPAPAPQEQAPVPAAPTGETQGPSPGPDKDKLAALTAELARVRRKNQELARLSEQPRQHPPQPVEPVGLFDDPDAYMGRTKQEIKDDVYDRIVRQSISFAKRTIPDFSEVMGEVDGEFTAMIELVQQDPSLIAKLRDADDPAHFAYETVKRHKLMAELKDPKEIEEFRAWKAQRATGNPAQPQPPAPPVIPKTLAGTPSRSAGQSAGFSGPSPLEALLPKL